jgi:hypothetical protein
MPKCEDLDNEDLKLSDPIRIALKLKAGGSSPAT